MNLIKNSTYALLLLSLSTLVSCQNDEEAVNPETGIIGSWRLNSGEYTFNNLSPRDYFVQIFNQANLTPTDTQIDQAVAAFEQSLENFGDGTVFEFKEGGNFISRGPDGTGTATWEIRGNNQLIITEGISTLDFIISSLNDSELRLLVEDEETVDLSDIGLSATEPVTIGLTLIFSKQ